MESKADGNRKFSSVLVASCVVSRRIVSQFGSFRRNTNSFDANNPFFPNTNKGGAIYAKPFSALELSFSEFWDNESAMGGALYIEGTITCFGSTFASNKATNRGGALYASSTALISVGRNTFAGNEAVQAGPSVFVDDAQFFASQNTGCDNAGCNGVANKDGDCLEFEDKCLAPTSTPTVSARKFK